MVAVAIILAVCSYAQMMKYPQQNEDIDSRKIELKTEIPNEIRFGL